MICFFVAFCGSDSQILKESLNDLKKKDFIYMLQCFFSSNYKGKFEYLSTLKTQYFYSIPGYIFDYDKVILRHYFFPVGRPLALDPRTRHFTGAHPPIFVR